MALTLEKNHLDRLRTLGVSSLYLFGSRAQGIARPNSDYDFAVLLHDASVVKPGKNTLPLYQKFYDLLTDVIPTGSGNLIVDIIFLQSGVSLELQANVVKYGVVLFDEAPRARLDYEQQVMMRIADLRPIIDMMDQAILQRI